MAKLFVSYSRRDSTTARNLIEAFKSIEQEVWVDWEAIPPAVDWLEQIFRGIEEADAFIFMISPDSIVSDVCKVEVGRAVLNNKRIIPIVLRDVNPKDTIEDIRRLNWTFIRETDDFEEGLAKIKTAIELDLDWLEEHRRLQIRALEWHRKKDTSLLLRGRDLRNARHMVQTYTSKDPTPTELQQKYIDHSQRTERNRTIAWILTGITIAALTVLSIFAYRQSVLATQNAVVANKNAQIAQENERIARAAREQAEVERAKAEEQEKIAVEQRRIAEEQERFAEAQRSAARAQIYQTRTGELYTSTLLALDSWDKSQSEEAEQILRKNISLLPLPVAQASQDGSIDVLGINPYGETFISASADGTICLRNVKDGSEVFCRESVPPVNDAIFVRDGQYIVFVDQSNIVQIINADDGTSEREINAQSAVRDLDVAPNGETLGIARDNGNITLLGVDEPASGADNFFLSGGRLSQIDFSPDGRWLAAGSQRGNMAVWNLSTAQVLSPVPHKAEILSLKFSPNSRFIISGGADNYAVGYDTQNRQEIFRLLHSDWVTDIDFPSGDSSWFATASDDSRVRIWELSTARERLIMFQDDAIADVTISNNGRWIAATGSDETVRVWSAYSGVEMYQIPLRTFGTSLGFSNDDTRLITSDGNGRLGIWDISEMTAPVDFVEFDKLTWISKFTPSGDRVIVTEANRVWSLNPQDLTRQGTRPSGNPIFEFRDDIYDLVLSPDSLTVGLSTYGDEYFIDNLQTRIPVRVSPSGDAYALAFTSDGSRFLTGTTEGALESWNIKTGEQIHSLSIDGSISSLAVSPERVAVGLMDRIFLMDPNAEQKTGELSAPGDNQHLAFNADGSMLASVNSSGQIQSWRLRNGSFEPLNSITKERTYSIAFNPRGTLLAIGTVNNVYLIDPASGEEVIRIPHKGIVYNVYFSPDGATLATASQKVVQLWDVSAMQGFETDDIVMAACSRLLQNFSQSQWIAFFGAEQPYEVLCDKLPVPE
jgi:WD40 repeat protein